MHDPFVAAAKIGLPVRKFASVPQACINGLFVMDA